MEHEYNVLSHLQENEITTQRKISKRTGLSLGAVNLLLKKMGRKGLIKIEKLNARTARYILTPKGMQEKSRLAYRYIRSSYRQILKINQILDYLLAEWKTEINGSSLILYGPSDEIREILTRHLEQKDISFELYDEAASPQQSAADIKLVLIWREEEEKTISRLINRPGHSTYCRLQGRCRNCPGAPGPAGNRPCYRYNTPPVGRSRFSLLRRFALPRYILPRPA